MKQVDMEANIQKNPKDAMDIIMNMSKEQINKLWNDDDQIK